MAVGQEKFEGEFSELKNGPEAVRLLSFRVFGSAKKIR